MNGSRLGRRLEWLLPLVTLLASACESRDIDRLARIGRKTAAHCEEITGGARARLAEGWKAVQASMEGNSVESRVINRIRWDKATTDSEVQVSCPGPGVVLLRGNVKESARSRVKELAEATEGVEKVIDELTVSP